MKASPAETKKAAATLCPAFLLWGFTFYLDWGIFWFKIAVSSLVLAGLSLYLLKGERPGFRLTAGSVLAGIISAALLYIIFWAGKSAAAAVFPFAGEQIGAVYGMKEQGPAWLIPLLLFFVTSPCEEIYWRGFLQKRLMERFGGPKGWISAAFFYAFVHIWSWNFMLICAAAVAGAFWGAMYWRLKDITPVIISHCVWSTFIFTVVPIP